MAAALFRSAAFVLAMQMAGAQGPAPAPPTGLIVGKTVDGATGAVISGAVVSISRALPPAGAIRPEELTPQELTPTRVISDSNGRFLFHGLAAAGYTIQVTKPGYGSSMFGRRSATDIGSQTLVLRDGEKRGDVTVSLWKLAAIGGTVVDEAGEPVVGLQIRVLKRSVFGGVLRFTQSGNQPTTDDRGAYRQSDLAPGDYIVGVVTTQTTVPDSLQEQYAAASKSGSSQDLVRELDRSRSGVGGLSMLASGQRLGSLLLMTPMGIGNSGDIAAPPITGGRVFVYPSVYHPAATTPGGAMIVRLGPGDERATIDFQLKPVVTSIVSGVLMGPNGPEALTGLDLIPTGLDSLQRDYDFATASTTTDSKGAFVFLGVPPGAYTIRSLKVPPRPVLTTSSMTTVIQTGTTTISSGGGPAARPPITDEPTYWASLPVTVGDKDVTELAMTYRTGARLSGRVEFEGAAVKPTVERLQQVNVVVSSADARAASFTQFTLGNGVIDATSSFKTYQLSPGRYVIRGPAFPGWTFKGAFLNGRDVSDTPLQLDAEDVGNIVLTYSDRPTDIIGTARDNAGPDGAATILVFPSQQTLWTNHGPTPRRFRSVRPSPDGVFRVINIPAGDYVVVGVHGSVPTDWQDPAVLRQLMALGSSTSVADGETKTVNVTTREIK